MNVLALFIEQISDVRKIIDKKCDKVYKFVFTDVIKKIEEENSNKSECYFRICALRTFSWEMLHVGHWNEVDISERIRYSLATFLEVILTMKMEGEITKTILIECLKELDTGILLGASILNRNNQDILKICAKEISLEISRHEEIRNIPMDTSVKTLPPVAVQLKSPATVKTQIDILDLPSIQKFHDDFFHTGRPVLLLNCLRHWPAFSKWTNLGYFIHRFGHRIVPIEIGSKYTESNWGQKLVPLKDFIERQFISRKDDTIMEYLAQHDLLDQIPELRDDIRIPDYCQVSDVEVKIWFGPSGTVSPMHFDKKHNLLAQIVGSKRLLLADPKDSEGIYPFDGKMLSNTSQLDLENVDEERFPKSKEVCFYQVHLNAGELLYIPPGWWHHVRALSNSISISFWWENESSKS
ncbi:lysine-specific demethylase 8 [Sergentomyia squamirostris]